MDRENQRNYLRLGDNVFHRRFASWGLGRVIEEVRSVVPGGCCLVRIAFQDGKKRVFDNSLGNASCCYYSGVIRVMREGQDE